MTDRNARALRVLHCPTGTAGQPGSLARAEREVGLDSVAVALTGSRYDFDVDEVLCQRVSWLGLRRAELHLLRRALREADIVHFNAGRSIAPIAPLPAAALPEGRSRLRRRLGHALGVLVEGADLPVLRRAGKGVVVTYQGTDARQRDRSLELLETSMADEVGDDRYPAVADAEKRRRIARFDRHADLILSVNPDLMHVLPPRARFLPYANVDPWRLMPSDSAPESRKPRLVVHAPTHRGTKGTRHLLAAVDSLRAGGVQLELDLVEGVSHAQALERYRRADVVVDQLLAGWYGGLAVEAMALGKPVIAYLRAGDLRFIPEAMRNELPVVGASPKTIEPRLRELLTAPIESLAEIGARSRAYVERWHDPARIAAELKEEYRIIMERRDRRLTGDRSTAAPAP